ncbi:MAG: hypothetical protein RIQ54_292 [Candidatus Parcubacteria bacterium]|jgi:hypothetical protein
MSLELVKYRPSVLQKCSTWMFTLDQDGERHFSMFATGIIYIIAGAFQLTWLYPIIQYWDITKKFLALGLFGCGLGAIWLLALCCTFFLFWIGTRIVGLSTPKKHNCTVTQTKQQQSSMRWIAFALIVGVIIDIAFLFFSAYVEDKSAVVFGSAFIGARILKWNTEAVLRYYNI